MKLMMSTPRTLLILGNGLDIAHGLPTKYTDFLDFIVKLEATDSDFFDPNEYCIKYLNDWNTTHETIKDLLRHICKAKYNTNKVHSNIKLLENCLKNNMWKDYFINVRDENLKIGNNWVDFEGEIKSIIEFIDSQKFSLDDDFLPLRDKIYKDQDRHIKLFAQILKRFINLSGSARGFNTIKELRDKLYNDLDRFSLAFEIYIVDFVEVIKISDLKNAIPQVVNIKPNYVLSFNYTRTYEKLYNNLDCKICHVHGVADKQDNLEESCSLVLGISEYLNKNEQDVKTDYVRFKKYSQRISKDTDKSYLNWFNEKGTIIGDEFDEIKILDEYISDIWIYGHSLDTTDKDILSRILKIPRATLHIFVRKRSLKQDITDKLIKIIGRDCYIEKGESNKLDFPVIDPNYA